MLRIPGDGLDLHVEVAGNGPPVILLHGFPENGHSWRWQIAPLVEAGFSPWVPNLRGYPPSSVSPRQADYHLRHLVHDVAAIVKASGHARAHVVGHDWGGIIAWTFAGLCPQLLDRLVIMNAPHMALYSAKVWHTSQLLRSWYAAFFQLPLLPERVLAAGRFRIVREIFRRGPVRSSAFAQEDIERYVDCLSQPGALKAALDYYRENMRSDGMALAACARTEARTLVLWGERDPTLGIFLLSGLARYASHVRIHRIAGASHWVQNEAPEEVNRVMTAFLRET
ncbi:alpha/beta fold hydrolase [Noviherbaspirillum pedocola]|uniref:Alpha/beta hydrolase n=1 Tax=Noviherbaspirillum pedocola TaxID=2801341 RepID=A0A934SU84_9BURK|nr:alpha/beta hydrolase [Noviherbaspirillum pedocola]MBK4735276.1 alpha/beta hydrolase [Noviherbaspirillum pedocola]